MLGNYFADIAVYRLPEKKYLADMKKHIDRQVLGYIPEDRQERKVFYEKYPERKRWLENHLWRRYGGAWQFNEIIGYVRLYIDGNQILGEYWQAEAKIQVRTRRKCFAYQTYKIAPERDLPVNESNSALYEAILQYLEDVKTELKGRIVDTSAFERLGPHVDWQAVVNQSYWSKTV